MALDVTKPLKVQDLGAATTKLTAKIAPAFKAAKVENGTVSFYTSSDTTSTAAFSFNFPEEIYLRQLGTGIVSNFVFDSDTYAGATNPNLDGKTVLTLAVRGDSDTVTYNFADMSTLVDAYTASDTALTVDNYKIKINLDASSDNILTLTNGGLFVDGSAIVTTPYTASDTSVDVADYKIKVNIDASSDNILALTANGLMVDGANIQTLGASDTSLTIGEGKIAVNLDASSDNILALTANGLLVDGSALTPTPYTASDTSITISDYKVKVNIAAGNTNALTLVNGGLMVDTSNLNIDVSQIDIDTSSLMPRKATATEGNIAVWDSNGSVTDSAVSIVDHDEFTEYVNSTFKAKFQSVVI